MSTPQLSDETQTVATYMAMVVRNAMEDFHCEHLTGRPDEGVEPDHS